MKALIIVASLLTAALQATAQMPQFDIDPENCAVSGDVATCRMADGAEIEMPAGLVQMLAQNPSLIAESAADQMESARANAARTATQAEAMELQYEADWEAQELLNEAARAVVEEMLIFDQRIVSDAAAVPNRKMSGVYITNDDVLKTENADGSVTVHVQLEWYDTITDSQLVTSDRDIDDIDETYHEGFIQMVLTPEKRLQCRQYWFEGECAQVYYGVQSLPYFETLYDAAKGKAE